MAMEKITFDEFPDELRLATYAKGAAALPTGEKVSSLSVSVLPFHPLLLETADEIPFFFYDRKAHLIGAAPISKEETLRESLKTDLRRVMAQYNLVPSDIVCWLGPSLTFSHTPVDKALIQKLIEMGYRAATKGTFGVVFIDLPVMNFLMLRALGIPAANIYLDAHDTFECSELFYSALRGDKNKNVSVIERLK